MLTGSERWVHIDTNYLVIIIISLFFYINIQTTMIIHRTHHQHYH